MWPWNHLAVGYLAYSLLRRTAGGERPGTGCVLAVAFGSQFPDLVDKPLGWGTALLPSGTTLAHSLLFAVPLSLVVVAAAAWRGRTALAAAFVVAYLLHLPADALFPVIFGGRPTTAFLLWPAVPVDPAPSTTIPARVGDLWSSFLALLATPGGQRYVLLEASLLAATALAWIADGAPGVGSRWSRRPS